MIYARLVNNNIYIALCAKVVDQWPSLFVAVPPMIEVAFGGAENVCCVCASKNECRFCYLCTTKKLQSRQLTVQIYMAHREVQCCACASGVGLIGCRQS